MFFIYLALLQQFIQADDQAVCIPIPDEYKDAHNVYKCNEPITSRAGASNQVIYISSCHFTMMKSIADGAAIFITLNSISYPSLIYNCVFEECVTTKNGGAIRIQSKYPDSYSNISKCIFRDNQAANGGAIYFNAIYSTISECTFINNLATKPTNLVGADFYYVSKDSVTSNTDKILLIQNCEFFRDKYDGISSIVHLSFTPVADFHFIDNIVNITDSASGIVFFSFSGQMTGDKWTLVVKNNTISKKEFIIKDDEQETAYGMIMYPGFTSFPKPENPTTPDVPSNPNCPSPPDDYVKLESFTNQQNRYVYGCEVIRTTKLQASRCVISLYSCVFDSINSEKENGGAIYLFTSLSSNEQMPTPKGDCSIHNCTFNECQGASGGAIYIQMHDSDRFTGIINCTFTNNKAVNSIQDVGGGALYIWATYVTISNCTFIDNEANAKGQEIYFKIYEFTDTEYPLLINNCTIFQNKVSSKSALIYLEWNENADFYFNYNRIKLADDLIAYMFEDSGRNISLGNLSCKANSLLPSHDLLCPKDTILYQRVKYGFQNADAPKEDIVFDKEDACLNSEAKRCQSVNTNNTYEHVSIEISKFSNFENEDNGGAVYLVNTGVTCAGTTYKECKSKNAGGGAIYIYNEIENVVNYAALDGVNFESCSAVFGGAAYVYSSSDKNEVTFNKCNFKNNEAKTSGNGNFFGGGALYLTVNVGVVNECSFINNKGGTLKVNEKFDEKPENNKVSASKLGNIEIGKSLLMITNCMFESEKKSKSSSLFFVNSNSNYNCMNEVKNCIFSGKLAKGTYHIDAQVPENVRVNSCKFSSGMKQAFNKNFIKDGSNNQAFTNNSMKFWFSIASFGVVFCAVVAAFVVKKRNNQNNETENHEVSLTSLDNEKQL